MNPSASSHDPALSLANQQHYLAQRCRRSLENERASFSFLTHPWSNTATQVDSPSPIANHLLEIFAPLVRDGLRIGNRTVDRAEPLASGLEQVLHGLVSRARSFGRRQNTLILHAMLPLYLAISDNGRRNEPGQVCSLSETIVLCREYVVLSLLDTLLERDLAAWLDHHAGNPSTIHEQLEPLQLDLAHLAHQVWEVPATASQLTNQDSILKIKPQDPVRRRAFWNLASQWLTENPHMTIPKELAVERAAWPSLREHFSQLLHFFDRHQRADARHTKGSQNTTGSQTISSDDLAMAALESLEACEEQIGMALQDRFGRKRQDKVEDALPDYLPIHDKRVVEIRSSDDPKLTSALDQQLSECRARQGSIALIVVRSLSNTGLRPDGELTHWQKSFVESIRANTDGEELRGFITPTNEVAMMVEDVDRSELTTLTREAIQQAANAHGELPSLAANSTVHLIAGMSFVSEPTRSFRFQQLTDSAWRCLEGAASQGSGAVKSIEVF